VLLAVVLVPLPWRVRAPAVLSATNLLHLHAVEAGEIIEARPVNDAGFKTGDLLFEIRAPKLEHEMVRTQRQLALVKARLQRITADGQDRSERVVLMGRLAALAETLDGLERQIADLTIHAPFDGRFVAFDPRIHPGRMVSPADRLATIVAEDSAPRIEGLVAASDFDRLEKDARGVFVAEEPEFGKLDVALADLSPVGGNRIAPAVLSDQFGGPVVTAGPDTVVARHNHHQAVFRLSAAGAVIPDRLVRGTVFLQGRSESLARRALRQVFGVLLRESGF
ncbi:MAG: hypothetical protein KDA41_02065, partial [Planctomycetales bacterium]|nr:hypothetical protein [Planctomycetales bacterium]